MNAKPTAIAAQGVNASSSPISPITAHVAAVEAAAEVEEVVEEAAVVETPLVITKTTAICAARGISDAARLTLPFSA